MRLNHERFSLHQKVSPKTDINGTSDTPPLHSVDTLLQHLAIHVKTNGSNVATLFGAE
jgi:hypothetical protein